MSDPDPDDYSNHYALLIGTRADEDGNDSPKFQATTNDVEWLAGILKACEFPPDNLKVLTHTDATKARILQEIQTIKEKIDSSEKPSTVVVFFSGHCRIFNNKATLVPYIGKNRGDLTLSDFIDGTFLVDQINLLYADKVLIVLNTYHAEAVIPKLVRIPLDSNDDRLLRKFRNHGGTTVFSATQASDKALTARTAKRTSKRYSPFTIAFGRALTGAGKKNKSESDVISTSEVIEQATAMVIKLTNKKQKPAFDYQDGNFPVGRCVDSQELFLGEGEDIVVEEQGDNRATPAMNTMLTGNHNASTTYNWVVNADQSILGNATNKNSGDMLINFITK